MNQKKKKKKKKKQQKIYLYVENNQHIRILKILPILN